LAEFCVPVRIAQVGKSGALGDTGLIVLFVAVLIGVVLVVVFRKKNRKLIFIFLFYS
jgi:predicted RND superfamily exporter protein